ncbi:hypothetical protein BGZ76_002190 [Entomortierella beljakovae]|nr:hypothetical protein BGZ76_002190 [Entomortierella beljakovae]
MPPKKSTSRTLSTTAPASAANFFQLGKKPTTTQRVIAAKKSTTTTQQQTLKTISKQDPVVEKRDQDAARDVRTSSNKESSGLNKLESVVVTDEIVSDSSLESPHPDKISDSDNDSTKRELSADILEPTVASPQVTTLKRPISVSKVEPNTMRIHREGISEGELVLRQFDLAMIYGPCLDLTRLERWERAHELGLSPPQDVKDLILESKLSNTPLFAGRV